MIQPNQVYKYVPCCICQSKTTRAHRLPSLSNDEDKLLRYAKWVNFAGIENVYNKQKYYWICEIHFEDNAFCNHLKLKILRTAVPTLNPPIYEGPSKEDGSPPVPTEPKEETLVKIFQEIADRQLKNEPAGQIKKFYKFLSTSSAITSKKIHNHLNRIDIQQKRVFPKLNSNDTSENEANDSVASPIGKIVSVSSLNRNLKVPDITNNSAGKPDYIEKGNSGSSSSYFNQRARPLILKKLPTSSTKLPTLQARPSVIRSSVNTSDLIKTLSKTDSSVNFLSNLDACSANTESTSSGMKTDKNISASYNKKPETFEDLPEILNSAKNPVVDNVVLLTTPGPVINEQFNKAPVNENIHKITGSLSSVVNLTANKKYEKFDILSTAIKNSDILPSEVTGMDEEVISDNKDTGNKQNESLKYIKKKPKVGKKKFYDPVLIDSILNKMKLKKNGPVCVVTLEKKPDKLFKGFSKNKLITLYKQQIKKNRKNMKANQGINASGSDVTKKVRKKRRCTCSIHCHRMLNGCSKNSSPVINVNSSVGVKFEGTAVNQNIMNTDPDLAGEELFNVENVFNVSTILTNVHDRSQVEQLCQMLIESVFRLKSLNIEGTMAKLQVYIAQVPEIRANRSAFDETVSAPENCKSNNANQNNEMDHDEESNNMVSQEIILNNFQENDSDQISSFVSLANEKETPIYNEIPVTPEVAIHTVIDTNNISNLQPKPKNVKVRLSTLHDHSYIKHESNYIFEKPEYLVKLINIKTYRCPRKTAKPLTMGISKKKIERHKNICLKLNKRIIHLRELIKKKNKNIKSMHRKMKYLGSIVCQEKGIKRIKYPKSYENIQPKQKDSSQNVPEDELHTKKKDESKMLVDINIDQLRIDSVVSINSFESTNFFEDNTQIKAKKAHENKTKKNMGMESFDVLYENLIEELCYNEIQL